MWVELTTDDPSKELPTDEPKKGPPTDWKAHLNNQGVAWIITPLHYDNCGTKFTREALGGGKWHNHARKLKNHENTSWYERKFIFKVKSPKEQESTNDGTGLQKYTMIEYLLEKEKEVNNETLYILG